MNMLQIYNMLYFSYHSLNYIKNNKRLLDIKPMFIINNNN